MQGLTINFTFIYYDVSGRKHILSYSLPPNSSTEEHQKAKSNAIKLFINNKQY